MSTVSRRSQGLSRNNWETKKKGSKGLITLVVILIIFFVVGASMIFFLFNANAAVTPQESDNIQNNSGTTTTTTTTTTTGIADRSKAAYEYLMLPNEHDFAKTIKDCKNVKKCKPHLPDEKYPNRQRIAIVSTGSNDFLFDILKNAILIYYNNDSIMMDQELELLNSHHVPAYGYGKSHGFTKIIRIMHSPLLVETAESLQSNDQSISLNDIIRTTGTTGTSTSSASASVSSLMVQGMKQVVRYHCRLSHVAAHTFMFNVDLSSDQFRNQVSEAITHIVAKAGHQFDGTDAQVKDRMKKVDVYLDKMLSVPISLSDTATRLMEAISNKEIQELKQVLQEELNSTNGLSKWPCKSLWDLDGIAEKDSENILSKSAMRLAPDCNAPFTSCFVKKDTCEMMGDAKCKN